MTDITSRLLSIHNHNRSSPLTLNPLLTQAAQKHAAWMASRQRMSHRGDGRTSPGDRIRESGYDWATYGENVAYGQRTPDDVMRVWLASPGHRRNIKSAAYREIGIGYATANSGAIYWCVTFGSRTFAGGELEWDESMAAPELEHWT